MTEKRFLPAGQPANPPLSRHPNTRQRILVVDDDFVIRRVNTGVLTYSGYQVDAAEDGADAWDALQLVRYDLLVTDNDMPNVTGAELIRKLQTAHVDLPVIMATGRIPHEEFYRHHLQPVVMLLKPYGFGELLTAVKAVLRAASGELEILAPPPNWQVQPPADRFRHCRAAPQHGIRGG